MGLLKPKRRKRGVLEKAIRAGIKESQKAKRKAAAEAAKAAKRSMTRQIEEPSFPSAPFPLGVDDLFKLTTTMGDGSKITNYVFPTHEVAGKFVESLYTVNEVLDDATELSGHDFQHITACVFDVPPEGWGFTRAVYEPVTKAGNPNTAPMKVYFESSAQMCSDLSYGGIVHYDPEGQIKKIVVSHYVTSTYVMKMQASRVRGELKVKSVVLLGSSTDEGQVWYKA